MAKQLMPRAVIEPHQGDIPLTNEQAMKISLFSQLKRKPSLDKYPGAFVLRKYHEGDVIYRQGEPGWTAYYALTAEDALAVQQSRLGAAEGRASRRQLENDISSLSGRLRKIDDSQDDATARVIGTVYLAVQQSGTSREEQIRQQLQAFDRIKRRSLLGPTRNREQQTLYIPVDGPITLSYDTLRADFLEGDLIGESSCLYRIPRNATLVAKQDCYVLELLRNILDQLLKDPAYKSKTDEVYKERILGLHLRKLSLFSKLSDTEFKNIHDNLELVSYEPGQLIAEERERAEAMYVVRSGLVKAVKHASPLLGLRDIRDWEKLTDSLRNANGADDPRFLLAQVLPYRARAALKVDSLSSEGKQELLYAINDLMKANQLGETPELKELANEPEFHALWAELPADRKQWTDLDFRKYNRILLFAMFPQAIRPIPFASGQPVTLRYLSSGECFGEAALIERRPREATYIAHGHPNHEGQVELVRIPRSLFRDLLESSSETNKYIDEIHNRRKKEDESQGRTPIWAAHRTVTQSDQFEDLGLIQGQKLMLVDLDRCTRCDECVHACVNTHDDGRTRLFLDGPRFDKYLIPATCRSCLDPVCMIGCPVASIHRGDNRQIVIEDWCIGCSLCADNCPYGSIQMHDLGVVPERSYGWQFIPESLVKSPAWLSPGFRSKGWLEGDAPLYYNRDMATMLLQLKGAPLAEELNEDLALCCRYEFRLSAAQLGSDKKFRLEVATSGSTPTLWLNGNELEAEKAQRGKSEYLLRTDSGDSVLKSGRNVIGVRTAHDFEIGDLIIQIRLDEVRRPQLPDDLPLEVSTDVTEKLVTQRAVVCDLCSDLAGGPACVRACPHEAALRVDARSDFPN